jgi:hypothetical protein
MWTLVSIALGFLAIVLWWRWLTTASASVLGQSDYTRTIIQFIRCVKDGGRLVLDTSGGGASVSLTRASTPGGNPELQLRLLGDKVTLDQLESLCGNLELLRIPFTRSKPDRGQRPDEVVLHLSSECVENGGRIVDLALSAIGVRSGDPYFQRFEGEFDAEADTAYLRDVTLVARDLAETRPQRALFDRILKHLK